MMSTETSPRASRTAVIGAFAAVYTIWGSTYFAIKLAIDSLPPFLMAGARFFLAGAILFAFARRPGTPRERLTWAHWRSALVIGGCLLLAGNGIVSWSEEYVGTGLVALLIATVPLWMALLAPIFGGRRISVMTAVGVGLGIAGVALLLRPGGSGATHWQTLVVLGSPLLWAIGSLYARRAPAPSQPATAIAMEMLAGGVMLALVGLVRGEVTQLHLGAVTGTSVGAFVYLVLIGALVGYSAYLWLLHHVSATSASTYAFVNPVVAVALGALVLKESVTPAALGAAVMIVAAVALILRSQARAQPAPLAVSRDRAPACVTPEAEVA
jgi:drug/metabolite transporter (DMT)-like permease